MVKLSSGIELNPNELTSEDREAIVKALEETKFTPNAGPYVDKPDVTAPYWYIRNGSVIKTYWNNDLGDNALLSQGEVYPTEGLARKEIKRREALQVLRGDTKGYEYNRERDGKYWTIAIFDNKLEADYYGEILDVIKFETREDAEASLNAHTAEWHIVLGVE